jgi:ankyrin repeat protein
MNVNKDYDAIIEALRSGDVDALENLAATVPEFPHGRDSITHSRWITIAVAIGSIGAVEWMLRQRVELAFDTEDGYTLLHSAIERTTDHAAVLELLLAAGAPVNAKGINDWTPAHMAAARDDVEALRILVRYGADLSIRTGIDDYATPLDEARLLRAENAVRYLETLA